MKYKRVGPFITIKDANKQLFNFNDNIKYCIRFSIPMPEMFLTEIVKIDDIKFSYRGLSVHGERTCVTIGDSYKHRHPISIGITDKSFNTYIFLRE